MASKPTGQMISRTRTTGGRLWQLLPVDWGRVQEVTNEPVPGHIKRWWFALGGTPAYLFFIQLTTGILLSFYYVPSVDHAYESVGAITTTVPFGWFVRSIHKWAGNLMVITVLLHMCRVFFSCAFRHPRQINWVIGCGLLVCTLVMGFTGYSLVYEQLSYWGITVAAELTATTPLIGDLLASFMRGGDQIGPNTLTRMYNLHVGILPVTIIILIGLHVAVLRIHGVSELSFESPEARNEKGGQALAKSMIGVKLLALFVALAALGCLMMAWKNPFPVRAIAHELTMESSRIFWIVGAVVIATSSVLLFRGHTYGLLLWLLVGILGLGKLLFDLANSEAADTGLWIAASVVLAITVVYGIARHNRFTEGKGEDKPFNFFPDHIISEIMIGTLLLFLLTLLSLVFPAHLGEKANPLVTPEHIKPEWYFFFQFRLLKLTGLNTAVALTGLLVVLIVAWPWVDALIERISPGKDIGVYIGIVAFVLFLVFTVWESLV
ncbi:MAG: cytochrome b N-terminal domain-containing protein [Phycisphaerales bacterium]|nr:cytochrome b N-terminal domain-containing protein [Phycisphaerales bacterium]